MIVAIIVGSTINSKPLHSLKPAAQQQEQQPEQVELVETPKPSTRRIIEDNRSELYHTAREDSIRQEVPFDYLVGMLAKGEGQIHTIGDFVCNGMIENPQYSIDKVSAGMQQTFQEKVPYADKEALRDMKSLIAATVHAADKYLRPLE